MNSRLISFLSLGLLITLQSPLLAMQSTPISTTSDCEGDATCKPVFLPFSQGENRARDYSGIAHLQNFTEEKSFNMYADIAIEYNQNFMKGSVGTYLFPNGTNKIMVGADNGADVDVRNMDLGLSPTFTGFLTINPSIKNVIVEPTLYLGFDEYLPGLFAWFKLPIVHTTWNLNCCEKDTATGGQDFPGTAVSNFNVPTPVPTAGSFNQVEQAFAGVTYGDKKYPLKNGRILCCKADKTGVADLPLHIGINFIREERGYAGLYARIVFPTGTMLDRHSLFDPTIGYDRWQLGGGFQGGIRIHTFKDETSMYFYGDVNATHIFGKKQCRVFDTTENGCWSRYLLLIETDTTYNQYTGRLANFADVFTFCATSQFDWNVDALFFLNITHKQWSWDLGYELQARAKEKITNCIGLCDTCNPHGCSNCGDSNTLFNKQYGVKSVEIAGPPVVPTPPSSTTPLIPGMASNATTYSDATISQQGTIDDPSVFFTANNIVPQLDIESALIPQALSNKIWGNMNYTWDDSEYPMFLSAGAEVAFPNHNKAPHVWAVRGKIGFAYN